MRRTPQVVLQVTVWRDPDKPLWPQVVKLAWPADLADEHQHYQQHVGKYIPTPAVQLMIPLQIAGEWGALSYS